MCVRVSFLTKLVHPVCMQEMSELLKAIPRLKVRADANRADREEAPSHEGEVSCSLNITCSLTGSCNRCFKDQWEDA